METTQTETPMETLYRQQRDCSTAMYQEVAKAYFELTGHAFEPTILVRNRVAPTDEDKAWLRSIGITI